MTRRVLLSLLTLLMVVCVGLSLLSMFAALFLARQGKPAASLTGAPTFVPVATYETIDNLPADIARQMDLIQQQVIQERRLQAKQPIQRALMTPEQLRQQVLNDFLADYTPEKAADDAMILNAFGLLPPEFDLHKLYVDLYSEQIAGYYDSKTKEMYVIQGGEFDGLGRMTYAHEFTHLLQDQTYDLREGLNFRDEYCEQEPEYCVGVQSLLEGDASLLEQLWFTEHATDQDRQQVSSFYVEYQSPVYDSAPEFLKQDFLFPYQRGLEFVQTLFDLGGWQAVDAAFLNPPVSSEQILHPDKYPHEKPKTIELPNLEGELDTGCRLIEDSTLGEWYTLLILAYGDNPSARLLLPEARSAVAGWGGDRYAVYSCPTGMVTVLRTMWDSETDQQEFWAGFEDYGKLMWGQPSKQTDSQIKWESGQKYVIMNRTDLETLWIMTPEIGMMSSVLQVFPSFSRSK